MSLYLAGISQNRCEQGGENQNILPSVNQSSMERISNSDIELPAPPPYTSVGCGENENEFDEILPPSYSDINNQSVVFINNYPRPPLTDGYVQDDLSLNYRIILPKQIRVYLIVNGIITILFGFMSIGIQIEIIILHSINHYYYGFWGGALIIAIGISTVVSNNYYLTLDSSRLFKILFLKTMYIAVLFSTGIIIMLIDRCDNNDDLCKRSFPILNEFLLGIFGLAFLLSIINGAIFRFLNNVYSIIS
jgi:hypothetical protein